LGTVDDFVLNKYKSLYDGVVVDAEADGDYVSITRREQRPIRFAVIKKQNVIADDIAHLLGGDVDLIVNIPRTGIFQADAISLCLENEVAWGGLADSMRAVRLDDPQTYFPENLAFVMRGLLRHSHVESVSHLDSRRLRITRTDGLPELVLYIEDTYQAEVTTVHFAIDRCSPFDIFVATNPNAGPTKNAIAAAQDAGLEILRWADTLRRLRQ
jgi:hypothetical protein